MLGEQADKIVHKDVVLSKNQQYNWKRGRIFESLTSSPQRSKSFAASRIGAVAASSSIPRTIFKKGKTKEKETNADTNDEAVLRMYQSVPYASIQK